MVDQNENDVGPPDSLVQADQIEVIVGGEIGLAGENLTYVFRVQSLGDLQRQRIPSVVDIRLEGQAKAGDGRLLEPCSPLSNFVQNPIRLGIVYLPSRPDQPACSGARSTMNQGSIAMQ